MMYSPCILRRNELHNESRMPCHRRPGTTQWSRRILKQTRKARSVNAGRNDILSRGFLSSRAAPRERWEGKKNTFSSLCACSGLQHRAALQLSAFTRCRGRRDPTRSYARRSQILSRFRHFVKRSIRVPMLSSGSGLADETVESIVGILGLRRWSANCITWYGLDMPWLGTRGTLDARESCEDTLGISNSDAGDVASVSCALLSGVRIMFVQESLRR